MEINQVTALLVTAFGKCTEWLGTFFDSIGGTVTIFITFFIILIVVRRLLGPLLGPSFASGSSDTVKPSNSPPPHSSSSTDMSNYVSSHRASNIPQYNGKPRMT